MNLGINAFIIRELERKSLLLKTRPKKGKREMKKEDDRITR